jgi:hypothetical protein
VIENGAGKSLETFRESVEKFANSKILHTWPMNKKDELTADPVILQKSVENFAVVASS